MLSRLRIAINMPLVKTQPTRQSINFAKMGKMRHGCLADIMLDPLNDGRLPLGQRIRFDCAWNWRSSNQISEGLAGSGEHFR